MAKIQFGWSEKNLLPQGAVISLAGQFYERVSGEVESELTVTCLVMDSGDDAAIFCSCDLVSVGSALLGSVRARLKDHPEIPAEKVMISAIHTHTAPSYARRSDALSGLSTKDTLRELAPDVKYVELVPPTKSPLMEKKPIATLQNASPSPSSRLGKAAKKVALSPPSAEPPLAFAAEPAMTTAAPKCGGIRALPILKSWKVGMIAASSFSSPMMQTKS
jgi:hypothetical protein